MVWFGLLVLDGLGWMGKIGLVWMVTFGCFGLNALEWFGWFSLNGLVWTVIFLDRYAWMVCLPHGLHEAHVKKHRPVEGLWSIL